MGLVLGGAGLAILFAFVVEGTGRFVEDQDGGIAQKFAAELDRSALDELMKDRTVSGMKRGSFWKTL